MFWTIIFGVALALALNAVLWFGGRRIRGAGGIVAVVWAINLAFALVMDDFTNWRFMFAVDLIAAAAILTPPCNPSRLVIGALYIAQLCFHGVFGWYELQGLEGPGDAYLSGLYVLGGAQILSLFIGAADDWSRKRHHRRRVDRGDTVSVAALHAFDGDAR